MTISDTKGSRSALNRRCGLLKEMLIGVLVMLNYGIKAVAS